MKKQTAVEKLIDYLVLTQNLTHEAHVMMEKAKQSEFNQIIEAHYWGGSDRMESKDPFRNNALNYYHEIFGL
jgi:low affinity Fe/Cu permease